MFDFTQFRYSVFALTLLAAGCTKDDPVPQEAPSTFRVRIENVISRPIQDRDERYPYEYIPYLVMEGMPEGEHLVRLGGVYAHWTDTPNTTDYNAMRDYSSDETITQWDWSSPLIWSAADLVQLLPGRTYYFTGMAVTDRGTYRSNTVEIRSEKSAPVRVSPDAYRIPVVFHLFPGDGGRYPKEDILYDMLEYANMVYGHYYGLPHQCDAQVCFAPAERDPQGRPLESPGIRYEQERVYVDAAGEVHGIDPDIHLWDMEQALNVWVCPFDMEGSSALAGFSWLPFFDAEHLLPGCDVFDPQFFTGIFLNSGEGLHTVGNLQTFAHEVGHFLGLEHVFEEDWCEDTPRYDLESYEVRMAELLYEREYADAPGEYFFSDNVMDYFYSVYSGVTPAQVERIRHTLRYAYYIPGEAGMTAPRLRSGRAARLAPNPVW